MNGGKGEAVPVPPIKRMLETYLSSLTRGTFGTRLSARTITRKAQTPVQNKMAMSAW